MLTDVYIQVIRIAQYFVMDCVGYALLVSDCVCIACFGLRCASNAPTNIPSDHNVKFPANMALPLLKAR